MIMTLCLLVYSALEYKLRLGLKLYGLYVLSQTKRKTQAPTAKWVFESLAGIHIPNELGNTKFLIIENYHLSVHLTGDQF